jgi:hypothetical protein
MILVTRFVAEAIAETAYDENIIEDNDLRIEVEVVLSELNIDEIKSYVAFEHGNEEQALDDIEYSFGELDMTSNTPSLIYWEA